MSAPAPPTALDPVGVFKTLDPARRRFVLAVVRQIDRGWGEMRERPQRDFYYTMLTQGVGEPFAPAFVAWCEGTWEETDDDAEVYRDLHEPYEKAEEELAKAQKTEFPAWGDDDFEMTREWYDGALQLVREGVFGGDAEMQRAVNVGWRSFCEAVRLKKNMDGLMQNAMTLVERDEITMEQTAHLFGFKTVAEFGDALEKGKEG